MKFGTKTLAVATAAFVALTLPATAQNKDWDIDESGDINRDEYRAGLADTKIYARWDTNGDGMIDAEEFEAGSFDNYDRNEDGMIDTNERVILDEEVKWRMRASR